MEFKVISRDTYSWIQIPNEQLQTVIAKINAEPIVLTAPVVERLTSEAYQKWLKMQGAAFAGDPVYYLLEDLKNDLLRLSTIGPVAQG